MGNRTLIISYVPDVTHMVEHNGSFKKEREKNLYPHLNSNDYKGKTMRSEVESFRNIKTKEAAEKIVNRRNKNKIVIAKYNGKVIYEQKDWRDNN